MSHQPLERPIRVLFVCTGNICRSPMAEAVLGHMVAEAGLANRLAISSVGTDDEDVGLPIHRGTRAILEQYGIAYRPEKRAELVCRADLEQADYSIGMTRRHLAELYALHPTPAGEVRRLLEFVPPGPAYRGYEDVPDPYSTGNFDQVYAMIDAGCRGLLAYIRQRRHLVA